MIGIINHILCFALLFVIVESGKKQIQEYAPIEEPNNYDLEGDHWIGEKDSPQPSHKARRHHKSNIQNEDPAAAKIQEALRRTKPLGSPDKPAKYSSKRKPSSDPRRKKNKKGKRRKNHNKKHSKKDKKRSACLCPSYVDPTCASNGKIYDNSCYLQCDMDNNPELVPQSIESCESSTSNGEGSPHHFRRRIDFPKEPTYPYDRAPLS